MFSATPKSNPNCVVLRLWRCQGYGREIGLSTGILTPGVSPPVREHLNGERGQSSREYRRIAMHPGLGIKEKLGGQSFDKLFLLISSVILDLRMRHTPGMGTLVSVTNNVVSTR